MYKLGSFHFLLNYMRVLPVSHWQAQWKWHELLELPLAAPAEWH